MDGAFAEPLVGMAPGVVAADDDDDAVHLPWPDSKMPLAILTKALPDNVMLMTFLRLTDRHDPPTYLLPLGHQYGVGEDPVRSI